MWSLFSWGHTVSSDTNMASAKYKIIYRKCSRFSSAEAKHSQSDLVIFDVYQRVTCFLWLSCMKCLIIIGSGAECHFLLLQDQHGICSQWIWHWHSVGWLKWAEASVDLSCSCFPASSRRSEGRGVHWEAQ